MKNLEEQLFNCIKKNNRVDVEETLSLANDKGEGFNINVTDEFGNTALHYAAEYTDIVPQDGDLSIIELLLNAGAKVNCVNHRSGFSPLYVAVDNGKGDIARKLLAMGAELNLEINFRTQSVLSCALEKAQWPLATQLLNQGAVAEAVVLSALTKANIPNQERKEMALAYQNALGRDREKLQNFKKDMENILNNDKADVIDKLPAVFLCHLGQQEGYKQKEIVQICLQWRENNANIALKTDLLKELFLILESQTRTDPRSLKPQYFDLPYKHLLEACKNRLKEQPEDIVIKQLQRALFLLHPTSLKTTALNFYYNKFKDPSKKSELLEFLGKLPPPLKEALLRELSLFEPHPPIGLALLEETAGLLTSLNGTEEVSVRFLEDVFFQLEKKIQLMRKAVGAKSSSSKQLLIRGSSAEVDNDNTGVDFTSTSQTALKDSLQKNILNIDNFLKALETEQRSLVECVKMPRIRIFLLLIIILVPLAIIMPSVFLSQPKHRYCYDGGKIRVDDTDCIKGASSVRLSDRDQGLSILGLGIPLMIIVLVVIALCSNNTRAVIKTFRQESKPVVEFSNLNTWQLGALIAGIQQCLGELKVLSLQHTVESQRLQTTLNNLIAASTLGEVITELNLLKGFLRSELSNLEQVTATTFVQQRYYHLQYLLFKKPEASNEVALTIEEVTDESDDAEDTPLMNMRSARSGG